jgi:Glycosyltransferase family 87/WD40-like Beta Propeller Repeat
MNQLVDSRLCPEAAETEARKLTSTSRIPRQSFHWLPAVEWCLLVALACTLVGHSFVPGWRTLKSEFPNYYLAAELYHRDIPLDRVYEWTWFQRQNDHLGVRDGLVSFAPNPPTLVLPLLPLTGLQPLAAKRVWLVFSVVFLASSLWFLHRVTSLSWRRLILISLLCVLPLSVDFLFARHYVLILLFICAAYYAATRDRHSTSGAMWSAAAAMKLFPALAVVLFIRRRNWRALAGFLAGITTLLAVSVGMFGVEVHRVFLREVLSQASRGDWLGPYALSQNSFITLWGHLFLVEPELNPSPLINSPALYSVALAITVTALVFGFLFSIRSDKTPRAVALHWAALVPLLLLLSTTSATDYSCLLIFTVVVGFDALLATGNNKRALLLLLLYVAACAPVPHKITYWFPVTRLVATIALYALLLGRATAGHREFLPRRWLAAALMSVVALTLYNLHTVRNREEDFSRRLQTPRNGYRFADPVPVGDGVAFTVMQPDKYGAALVTGEAVREIPMSGDVLSVAGSETSGLLYSELTARKSLLARVPVDQAGSTPESLTEGQEPALSANGKWLAFIREEQGRVSVWLLATDSKDAAQKVLPSTYQPLEVTVTDDGDVIAAAGTVSDPHLVIVRRGTRDVAMLSAFPHPARYPSISPDGKRLAFSRRDYGFWHLVVHRLATGDEQQLTHASCNASSPSWANAQTLLYATDCGRGIGLSAIARVVVPN